MPRSPLTRIHGRTPLRNRVMACCRVVVRAGFVALTLLGAFVTPPAGMLLVAPLTGAVAGLFVAGLHPVFPAQSRARPGVLLTASTGAAFVPFVNGVDLLGSAGGVVALVLLVLGSCLAADRLMDLVEDSPPNGAPGDARRLRAVLPSLSTAVLLQEWRTTQQTCGSRPSAAEGARAVQLRELLLDELARRDPVAVERWLASGDWSSGPRMGSDRDVAG